MADCDPQVGGRGDCLAAGRVAVSMKKASAVPTLVFELRAAGLSAPTLEYRFWPGRRFAFDLAWPDRKLALEVEGVIYGRDGHLRGRHVSITGFRRDAVKYTEASLRGWMVIRCLPAQVTSGEALGWIERAFAVCAIKAADEATGRPGLLQGSRIE